MEVNKLERLLNANVDVEMDDLEAKEMVSGLEMQRMKTAEMLRLTRRSYVKKL